MSLRQGDQITVIPDKAVAGGWMLARHAGQVVLVSGAIPGERVVARVERVSRRVAEAGVVGVIEPSVDRRRDESQRCGGSVYAHIAYARQLSLKAEIVADAFGRIGKVTPDGPIPVMASRETGYRMRARLHVREGRLGFFREGTHELCDVASTGQLLDETVGVLTGLQSALTSHGVASGACEIVENVQADERAVLVESDTPIAAGFPPMAGITGVSRADHTKREMTCDYGPPFVVDRLSVGSASVVLTHHIRSFFQGNRWLLADLANRVIEQIPDDHAIDLYAGVGLFAVSLAAMGRRGITAVEGDRSSAGDLATNAQPYGDAIDVKCASVEDFLAGRRDASQGTMILDPPRTGASVEALSAVVRLKPARMVYVSCDPATLARDVRRCIDAGYRLAHLEGFDLFPNTAHVEVLAVLVREPTSRPPA